MDASAYASNGVTVDLVKNSSSKVLVLLNSGQEKTFQDGKKKLTFMAEIDLKQKEYTPNKTTLSNLIKAWGTETNAWLGKKVSLTIGIQQGKESVIGFPGSN